MVMMGFPETCAAFGAMVIRTTAYDINDEDGDDEVDHFKICGAFAAMMAKTTHAHDDGWDRISTPHEKARRLERDDGNDDDA